MSAPLRVAVVGSGPAGFYAAGHLLEADLPVEVDLIERLPTPWGLVRLGVAPGPSEDQGGLAGVRADRRAARVSLPRQRRRRSRPHARGSGSGSTTRSSTRSARRPTGRMGIPGEDLPGSWAATEFVAWYNGHPGLPAARVRSLLRARSRGRSGKRRARRRPDAGAVARGDPADRHHRPGDRGDPRLRPEGDRDARPPRAGPGRVHDSRAEGARGARRRRRGRRSGRPRARPVSEASLEHDTNARRNVEVLREYAAREPAGKHRTIRLRFAVSPVAILGSERVEGDRGRPKRAGRRRVGPDPRRADGRPRDDSVRDRVPQRRLSRGRPAGHALRREAERRSRTGRDASSTPADGICPVSTARAGSSEDRAA